MSFQAGSNYNVASRYFPEINDDRSSNPNLSPLNEIIQELKRKNVVASAASGGPQLALDSRSDPWGSSEVSFGIADDGVTMSFSSNDRASTMIPLRPSMLSAFGNNDPKGGNSASPQQHQQQYQQQFTSGPSHEKSAPNSQQHQHTDNKDPRSDSGKTPPIVNGQDTSTNPTGHRRKSILNPWLSAAPPKHAEELLQVTPQLRIISSTSTDMNVAGLSTSNNVLGIVLSSTPFHHHFNPMNNKSSNSAHHRSNSAGLNGNSTTSASSTGSGATTSDYKASLIRDRSNHQAATELASLLWICAHEMSLEDYGRVESKTFTSVFALVHSKDNMDRRMAGLAALDALIDAPSADEERKAIKFANTLSGGLRSARGNYEFLSAVSKALGHMATRTANVDFVESEVTRALEWLRTDRSDRRYVCCLQKYAVLLIVGMVYPYMCPVCLI